MFKHIHPYKPFLFEDTTKLIVGTLPPPRFTTGELKELDVDFSYGSRDGQLWPILDTIFELNLRFENTNAAIEQRMSFLRSHKIGICDIVASADRDKIDASDLGMQNVRLRNILGHLEQYPNIKTLLFTGGNSKNGPEYFFRRHLKEHNLSLVEVKSTVPRIHQFKLPRSKSVIKTVSLTAPSGAANRAVGSLPDYKKLKAENPKFNTLDYRIMQYREFF